MELTPEQTRRIEQNRLRAMQRLAAQGSPSTNRHNPQSTTNFNNNNEDRQQPQTQQQQNRAATNQPQPNAVSVPLLPKSALTKRKYIDVDLTTIKDTKAGFLLAPPSSSSSASASAAKESEQRKRVTYLHNQLPHVVNIPPSANDDAANNNPSCCRHCGTMTLDVELYTHYRVLVCTDCRQANPEQYTLLTKTEAKEDYLLTDEELRDAEKMPHWDRPNPRKSTYARMKLYLRCQVEEFAYGKWGGGEGLDREWERRQEEKRNKKERDYRKKMLDLRNRTRTSLWQQNGGGDGAKGTKGTAAAAKHQHVFAEEEDMMTGEQVERCRGCGKLRGEAEDDGDD